MTGRLTRIVANIQPAASRTALLMLIAGLCGHAIRDQSAALGVLMYLPLVLVGFFAIALDLANRGRALKTGRFLLTITGTLAIAVAASPMIGHGVTSVRHAPQPELKILQWNVHWGGGPFRSLATWKEQRAEILRHAADLVVLSEPPESSWMNLLIRDFGPTASYARAESGPATPERFRMVVVSNWPLKTERTLVFPGGHGLIATANIRGQMLRLLVVDGISDPFRSRLPFLHAIADLLRTEAWAERAFDLVLGDFNTPARSLGFDEWSALGYQLTSRSTSGWRGSFPSWLPLYDIDHVWVRQGYMVTQSDFFPAIRSDHRGQVVAIKK